MDIGTLLKSAVNAHYTSIFLGLKLGLLIGMGPDYWGEPCSKKAQIFT